MEEISMLRSVRKTAQMGMWGIDAVKSQADDRGLAHTLEARQAEYTRLFQEAGCLLRDRGARPRDVPRMLRSVSRVSARLQVRAGSDPSEKIAEMLMKGHTLGMIKTLHNLRRTRMTDPKVRGLSHRLLQTEQAGIEEMKAFL